MKGTKMKNANYLPLLLRKCTFLPKIFVILFVLGVSIGNTYSQNWSGMGGGTGWGKAVCVYNNELYAGGQYGILKWNGSSWLPVGSGVNGEVDAMVVYNGNLIVSGSFSTAGGIAVLNIAQWDGTTWSDFGGGPDNITQCMTVYNGDLIVGGYFLTVEGVGANYIAKYNSTNGWQPLGSGMGGSQGQVMALTVYNGELIAAGFFTTSGGITTNHIARWNGSTWNSLGTGINWIVYTIAPYNGSLIAGGLFATAGGVAANDIASWDGSNWSALGSGCGGGFYPYVFGLAVFGTDLYVGGLYTTAGGLTANGIAKWNGSTWSTLGTGFWNGGSNVYGAYAIGIFNNNLVATGIFTSVNGIGAANIAEYNGLTVTGIQNPNSNAPDKFRLEQNYPNPFNPSTKISYALPKAGKVELRIYDVLGKEVAVLVDGFKQAGKYEVTFNASGISSGVYFYRLLYGNYPEERKMILVK